MKKFLTIGILAFSVPGLSLAHEVSGYGPQDGDREFTLSGTGASDKDFDNSSVGLSADLGWHLSKPLVAGIRQSITYADIKGENASNDFWNGSTRGYVDWHFGTGRLKPFVGASLGAIYGDGVDDTGIAGVEVGLKYYVLPRTFVLGRAEYQFLFEDSDDAEDNYNDGSWAYILGLGYNF